MGLFGNKNKKEKEYLESLNIRSMMNEDFCLEVDNVFIIMGVGTVVTGDVISGICHTGDRAILQTPNGNIETRILQIDVHENKRKSKGIAYRSEHVGISLRGVLKEQVTKGDKLFLKEKVIYEVEI